MSLSDIQACPARGSSPTVKRVIFRARFSRVSRRCLLRRFPGPIPPYSSRCRQESHFCQKVTKVSEGDRLLTLCQARREAKVTESGPLLPALSVINGHSGIPLPTGAVIYREAWEACGSPGKPVEAQEKPVEAQGSPGRTRNSTLGRVHQGRIHQKERTRHPADPPCTTLFGVAWTASCPRGTSLRAKCGT